eukprot:366044-Chlamydomonas_euryale.AAC.1
MGSHTCMLASMHAWMRACRRYGTLPPRMHAWMRACRRYGTLLPRMHVHARRKCRAIRPSARHAPTIPPEQTAARSDPFGVAYLLASPPPPPHAPPIKHRWIIRPGLTRFPLRCPPTPACIRRPEKPAEPSDPFDALVHDRHGGGSGGGGPLERVASTSALDAVPRAGMPAGVAGSEDGLGEDVGCPRRELHIWAVP